MSNTRKSLTGCEMMKEMWDEIQSRGYLSVSIFRNNAALSDLMRIAYMKCKEERTRPNSQTMFASQNNQPDSTPATASAQEDQTAKYNL